MSLSSTFPLKKWLLRDKKHLEIYLYIEALKCEIRIKAEIVVETNDPPHCIATEKSNTITLVVCLNWSDYPNYNENNKILTWRISGHYYLHLSA